MFSVQRKPGAGKSERGESGRELIEGGDVTTQFIAKVTNLWPSRADMRRMIGPIIRGTAIGSLLGILPGGGALLSSFVAYNVEKKTSRNSDEFGKGYGERAMDD